MAFKADTSFLRFLTMGAIGVRATIAESRAVQGELLVMKVYCPDELADFQEFVDGLKLESSGG